MRRSNSFSRLFFMAAVCVGFASVTAALAGTEPSGNMATGRYRHISAPLDGGALVAGGFFENTGFATSSAEVYNYSTTTFTPTAPMGTARAYAGAAGLSDWRVLVVGGATANQTPPAPLASAELFDPATGSWTPTGQTMNAARQSPVAVRLTSGLVLVIAGDSTQSSCEIFDPMAGGVFTPTGSLLGPRVHFAAAALDDGRVLVVGGQPSADLPAIATAEIWDPATGVWTSTGSMATPRANMTATKLWNGKVLVVAGMTGTSASTATATAEIFDPATGLFTPAGSLATARSEHTATASAIDGSVIVAGGTLPSFFATASIERYETNSGTWAQRGSMVTARAVHGAVALNDGDILISGGYMQGPLASSDLVAWQCVASNPSLNPTNVSMSHFGGTSNISVTHPAGCTWRVTNVPSWVSVNSGAPGSGNGTVNYTVASNSGSLDGRGATILIGDTPFSLNQGGNACANATLTPSSQSFGTAGGSFTVSLTAASSCSWAVSTFLPAWITATPPPGGGYSGNGSATFTVTVASNSGAARSANFPLASKTTVINQAANNCFPAPTISPASRAFTVNGGTATVSITAPSACTWSVTGKPTWVTMATSGTGNASLTLTVPANAGAERSATFTVAGNSFSATQDANPCVSATLAPTSASHSGNAETGTIAVTASSACSWTAGGLPPWMTLTSGASGTGNGTVAYSIAANTGAARSVTLSIAGRTFVVNQAAGVCYPAPTLSPTSRVFTATGGNGTGTVNVTAPAACPWTVASVPAWINVTSAASGTGNAVVTYAIAANTGAARSASLIIANASHSATQSAPGIATMPAARMLATRAEHSATSLADGRVLLAGGISGASPNDTATASTEIYDPFAATFAAGASLAQARAAHAAVKLADGRVLVVGGVQGPSSSSPMLASAEIYDPAAGTWTLATGSLATARKQMAAVVLADGKVLVTGGVAAGGPAGGPVLAASEVFDPSSGLFSPTGSTLTPRRYATAATLPDGRVLLVGGRDSASTALATAELWNPATGAWTPAGTMALARGDGPSVTVLAGGKVLIAGGFGLAELYDPATGVFSPAGTPASGFSFPSTVTMADGRVYLMGGSNILNVERYDPALGTWQVVGQFSDSRSWQAAALAGNGKILITGGYSGPLSSAELFDPAVCPTPATLSPASQAFGASGGSATVSVTLTAGCPRTASSGNPSWISASTSGTGSGTASLVISSNPGVARSATIGIAGAPFTVSQAAVPPPPPATAYCASRGSTSSYEWIQQVNIAGQARVTGNNGGYADFTTSTAAIPLARGSNAISVTAGGGYSEIWRIWIDFNNDLAFSADELVFSGAASGTIASTFTVPSTVSAGTRRMRISMSYGSAPPACGTFTYGEVEDYSVTIP